MSDCIQWHLGIVVAVVLLTPFPGWQDKTAVCGLQDELPMRMVADKGEVERD